MSLFRRALAPYNELSPVNQMRIDDGQHRPALIEANQWHEGDPIPEKLNDRYRAMLADGDYIVNDDPQYPYVWKKEDFEDKTDPLPDL